MQNIIIEGTDSSGKNVIAKEIARLYGYKHIEPVVKNIPIEEEFHPFKEEEFNRRRKQHLDGYKYQIYGAIRSYLNLFVNLDKIIVDRFHLSEYVYSKFYKRASLVDFDFVDYFLHDCETKLILLEIDYETYVKRLTARKESPDPENLFNLHKELFSEAFEKSILKKVKIDSTISIENTMNSLKEFMEI